MPTQVGESHVDMLKRLSSTSATYCRSFVQKHDYESWLLSPFYPKHLRDDYFALKAFQVELAMIQDHVSNASLGRMRMQFWREAIKDTAKGNPPEHPITIALCTTFERVHLPLYHFSRIIDARDAELTTPGHMSVESLTQHAEATSSSMFYLLSSLLSLSSSTLDHAISHLGVAQTLTTLLRGLPYHAKHGSMVIPAEITSKHGVVQEEVFRNGHAKGLDAAVFEFATLANDHLLTARNIAQKGVPPAALPILLAGVPMSNILGRLEETNFDIFAANLQIRDWRLPWKIWKSYFRGVA